MRKITLKKYEQKTLILDYFSQKRPILDHFWPKKGQFRIFCQKAKLSLFYSSGATASWEKSEKSDARISQKIRTDVRTSVNT